MSAERGEPGLSPETYEVMDYFLSGIYLHYKGGLYEATGLAHDANNKDRVVVQYVPLKLEGSQSGPRHAVRTLEDWLAYVHRDGSVCSGGHTGICTDNEPIVPRFRRLGIYYEAWMADADTWEIMTPPSDQES